MLRKLKQLSLLTIAESRKTLKYAVLQEELDFTSESEVESAVISTIDAGLIEVCFRFRR